MTDIRNSSGITNSTPRLEIAGLENEGKFLVVAFSHASYDAWSLRLMLYHLERFYTDNRPLLDDTHLTAQYVYDLQREHKSAEADQFWSSQLMTARPTLVTIDESDAQHPAILKQKLAETPPERVRAACRKHGITLQSLGLATWTLFLITLTRQTNVNFGVVVSGRRDEATEKLVFPTFNTVVFRPGVDTDTTKDQLLLNVHDQIVTIFEYQQFPLSKALGKVETHGRDLFNTLFTFQRSPVVKTQAAPLFEEIDLGEGEISPPYAINVELQETSLGLEWTIATQDGVMSNEDVENTFKSLDVIMEFLIGPKEGTIFQVEDSKVSICGLPSIVLEEEREDVPSEKFLERSPSDAGPAKAQYSKIESQIRDIFSEVSGIDAAQVSNDTSLYHLGLDSVSAIKVSRLLKEAGLKVPVSVILKHQTVAKIALAVSKVEILTVRTPQDKTQANKAGNEVQRSFEVSLRAAGISQSEAADVLPATGGQVYMLDMWRASQGRLFYATFSFKVKHCSRSRFESAFKQLVREVPALRTRFMTEQNKTYQVVFNAGSAVHGPVQYELTDQGRDLIVALHIHHALYDAISVELMVRRLKRFCSADVHTDGDEGQLCTDQQLFLDALQLNKAGGRRFWTAYLDGVKHKTTPAHSFDLPRTELFVPELLHTASLERVARRSGVSFQAMFFAVVARVHAQHEATSEKARPNTVVIGVYLANRSLDVEGISDLVAPTFNIVPLKVTTSLDVDILEAARQAQTDLQEISRAEHCGISLRDIHAWVDFDVDCYVNFLRLPDAEVGTVRTKEQSDTDVEIEHAEGELRERAKALIQVDKAASPFVQGGVVDEDSTEWCLPALDVEAKIDGQGNLAVGMFAPGDMFDEGRVKKLMDELRSLLQGVGTA
ncbi:hypothetical protein ES702_04365 [subsurface metagenome]